MDSATRNQTGPAVIVKTTARLHLGFLNPGDTGRRFGSIGLSLDAPETRIVLRRDNKDVVTGVEVPRAADFLRAVVDRLGVRGGHRLEVSSAIPAHAGLGSGTQLALAIAGGLRALHGLGADIAADAAALSRGARSGAGAALFQHGGFVVDGGRGADSVIPPVLARVHFPADWAVLVVTDPNARGLSGGAEIRAFRDLRPMPRAGAAEICRLVLLQVLPALAERDLAEFGAGIAAIQALLGDHFAPAQNGSRFMSPAVGACLDALARHGATGVGQSSWGPTGFAFADATQIPALETAFQRETPHSGLDMAVRRGLNRGAAITVVTDNTITPGHERT
jgi:beta-RFAP synthase